MEYIVDQIASQHLRGARSKDDFVSAICPFHKSGQETHPSFWINRHTGSWGCWSCDSRGVSLKALLKNLGLSSSRYDAEIAAAADDIERRRNVETLKRRNAARKGFQGVYTLPDSLLGVFDWLPTQLIDAGYPEELLAEHDIGFDRRNSRITFPIRDVFGQLVGISGRATELGDFPKYLIYNGRRVLNGKEVPGELGDWFPQYSNEGVRDHLWRGHFVNDYARNTINSQIIIVEGFKAALWMVKLGWTNVVALMGARISPQQEKLVRKWGAETFVLLDNNEAGIKGAEAICGTLANSTFPVYRCRYLDHHDEGYQPDDLSEEELEVVLSTAERAGGHHVRFQLGCQRLRRQESLDEGR